MWQKNYQFDSIEKAIQGISWIVEDIKAQSYSDGLCTIFAAEIGQKEMQDLKDTMDRLLPRIKKIGISEYNSEDITGKKIKLNLTLSNVSSISVHQFVCEPGGETEAAQKFRQVLEGIDDIKGIGLFPAGMALNVSKFLEIVTEGKEDVPVFGAMAGTRSQSLRGKVIGDDLYSIGEELISSGFSAVVYAGSQLQVMMDYILGWQPLGKEMTITLGEPGNLGEGCIKMIDGQPAINIYKKYLGVEWDENFVWNICEFPLMIRRNGMDICMVPMAMSENGNLYVSGPLKEGEKIRFSYGTWEDVVGASLAGSLKMEAFGPEAVFLSLCGNRVNYLREDAHIEWDFYRAKFPELVFCHGHYEIAWQHQKGGVLNSSFIAVGMKEQEVLPESAVGIKEQEALPESAVGIKKQEALPESAADIKKQEALPESAADVREQAVSPEDAVSLDQKAMAHQTQDRISGTDFVSTLDAEKRAYLLGKTGHDGPIPLNYRMSHFLHEMTEDLLHLQRHLKEEVERKTIENARLSIHVVETLADSIDAKDTYTSGHSKRVAEYSKEIARRAGYSQNEQENIYVMGLLHDVGKIGVPDAVINKPGKLNDEEFEMIKTHPSKGAQILGRITEMPRLALGARWHHERFDGRGYPDGIRGDQIPQEARIIAVADAYDAMTSNRSYRDVMPQERVRAEIEKGKGTQFDPVFADIMLSMIDEDDEYRMREK